MTTPNYPTIEEMREWVARGYDLVTGNFCSAKPDGTPCGGCALTASAVLRGVVHLTGDVVNSIRVSSAVLHYWESQGIEPRAYYHGFDLAGLDDLDMDVATYNEDEKLRLQCRSEGLLI